MAKSSTLKGRFSNTVIGEIVRGTFVPKLDKDGNQQRGFGLRVVSEEGTTFPSVIARERIAKLDGLLEYLNLRDTDYVLSKTMEFEATETSEATAVAFYRPVAAEVSI